MLPVTCVTSKREKDYYSERYGQVWREALSLPGGSDKALKDFVSCKPVFALRKQVFWVVAPCGWLIASRRFEGTYRLHLQDYASVN